MNHDWTKGGSDCLPPLGDAAARALERVPGGAAFHLELVTTVCNQLHAGRALVTDCAGCRHRAACRSDVDAGLLFVAGLSRKN